MGDIINIYSDIPVNWSVSKLKYFSSIYTGNSLNDAEKNKFSNDQDGLEGRIYISSKDINVNNNSCNYDTDIIIPYNETKYKLAPLGSSLLCIEGGSAGKKLTFTKQEVCFVNKLACFTGEDSESSKFIYYYLQSDGFKVQFNSSLSGLIGGVSLTNLNDFQVPIPPKQTQIRIAEFLDKKTAEIDTIIQKKESLLLLLEEKKKAIINEAITGKKVWNGNAWTEPVEVKDSGIEWLGEIPEHWELTQLKYLTEKVGSGVTPRGGAEVYTEEGVKFIRSQNVYFDGLRLDDVVFIDEKTHLQMENSKVVFNDVLLNITGGSIGRSCVVEMNEEFNVNQHVCIIRPTDELNSKYLNYFLYSNIGQTQIRLGITGGNREGLNFENLKSFIIPKLNVVEQELIVDTIKSKVLELNSISNKIQAQINKLKEYRQSLISEAVTGKIDI